MEFLLARAMQISCLEHDQIERLHKAEEAANYCFPNWNIQDIFNLRSIKDTYGISHEYHAQLAHSTRLFREIERLNVIHMADGEGRINESNVPKTHAFDWAVYNLKGNIIWEFCGGRGQRSSKIVDMVESEGN